MSELTIRLTKNRITGKREIKMGLVSDAGATPMEHEEDHRQLVDRVMDGGTLALSGSGQVSVTRGATRQEAAPEQQPAPAEPTALSNDNG